MTTRFTSLFHLSVWLLAGQVSCGSIAAWWNTRGPSFIIQDDNTGGIRYSLCNGNSTPIFPNDKTLTVPLTNYPPRNQTSLATTGWTDDETTWASIFYLDNDDNIINAVLKCDWDTGHWQNTGEYITSKGSPKVASDTGLSVILLGPTEGYRVFYNDLDGTLHQIRYTNSTSWVYYGTISHDVTSAHAIASTFSHNNISIVRPRDGKNIGVSQWNSDNLWHISTFPQPLTITGSESTNATAAPDLEFSSTAPSFSLPAWDGTTSSLAMALDGASSRSIFYIGTDRNVYRISSTDLDSRWAVFPRPGDNDDTTWPLADTPGAPIGIASDPSNTGALRLYYVSGGRVIEAVSDNGSLTASKITSFNEDQSQIQIRSESSTGTAEIPYVTGTPPSAQSDGNLSDGAKTGISVGVTLGIVIVGGAVFVLWLLRRRQRDIDEATRTAEIARQRARAMAGSPSSGWADPSVAATAFSAAETMNGDPGNTAVAMGIKHGPGYNAPEVYSPEYQQLYQSGYAEPPPQGVYTQQQQQQMYAVGSDGYKYGVSPATGTEIGMTPYPQQGVWTDGMNQQQQQQQQQYYQQQQLQQQQQQQQQPAELQTQQQIYYYPKHAHEMPDQRKPVEMLGEGHYKEAP